MLNDSRRAHLKTPRLVKLFMTSEESKIRSIERKIDEYYREHKFQKLPASIAIQYILIAFEYAVSPLKLREDRFSCLYASTHALLQVNKQALMESLNWIGDIKENEKSELITIIDSNIYQMAQEFLALGDAYHAAVSAYTMWGRGLATARLIDDRTVSFQYNPEQVRYDMLDLKLDDRKTDDILHEFNEKDEAIFKIAMSTVKKFVKQVNENNVVYSIREIDVPQMMRLALKINAGFTRIPDGWEIFGLTTSELKRFWASLVSIGMLHNMAVYHAFNKFTFKDDLLASMIIIHPVKDWCRQLSRWSGLSHDRINSILNYHTYSSRHIKRDIILTPFIKVSEKHVAISPGLIITNNLSRNFLKHLAKNFREKFDGHSNVFASDMISKIRDSIRKPNLLIKTNIVLPERGLPDIDLCLVNEQEQAAMLAECRWTISAADPYEVADKVEIEREKLLQMARLKEFITKHSENLFDYIKLGKKIIFKQIYYVIIFENHAGSALTFTEDIPIINVRIFTDLINANDTLGDCHLAIIERRYLPMKNQDFKIKEETHEIGGYRILWTGFY